MSINWSVDLHPEVLWRNTLAVAPWMATDAEVKIVAIDVDTTGLEPSKDKIWRLGFSSGISTRQQLVEIDISGNLRVSGLEPQDFENSLEAAKRVEHTGCSLAEACEQLYEESKTGDPLEDIVDMLRPFAADEDITLCSPTLTTSDLKWLNAKLAEPVQVQALQLDIGMLVKSAGIPTEFMSGRETPAEFYARVHDRFMRMPYSVSKLVLPTLRRTIVRFTSEYDDAARDSYASLCLAGLLRQDCYQAAQKGWLYGESNQDQAQTQG